MRWLLRLLARLFYVGVALAVFGLCAWFSFRHHLQEKPTKVPELVGVEPDQARLMLAERGLTLRLMDELARHDTAVEAGRIRVQEPGAGNTVRPGATVRASLSLGPQILVVPDLSGSTSRAAALELERSGLHLGLVTTVSLPGRDGVIGQDPGAGAKIAPGTNISILVAQDPGAPPRILPDFVGHDLTAAKRALDRYGYRLGTVRTEQYTGVADDRILRQYPLPGYPATRGYPISFVVSRDPDRVVAPGRESPELGYTRRP